MSNPDTVTHTKTHPQKHTDTQQQTKKLTCAGHGGRVFICAEIVLFTSAGERPLMVGDAVGRALRTLRVAHSGFIEARSTHWKQRESKTETLILYSNLI